MQVKGWYSIEIKVFEMEAFNAGRTRGLMTAEVALFSLGIAFQKGTSTIAPTNHYNKFNCIHIVNKLYALYYNKNAT